MKNTLKTLLTLTLALSAQQALAGADCTKHPKEKWVPEAEMKSRLEKEGYKIKIFKVDGNCYEIYGHDKDGKKVEIYFDTATGAIVKEKRK